MGLGQGKIAHFDTFDPPGIKSSNVKHNFFSGPYSSRWALIYRQKKIRKKSLINYIKLHRTRISQFFEIAPYIERDAHALICFGQIPCHRFRFGIKSDYSGYHTNVKVVYLASNIDVEAEKGTEHK
jgi:hypothetical protein